jgi:hypothetical protein
VTERAGALTALASAVFTAVEVRVSPRRPIGPYSIDDHSPSNYVDVSKNIEGQPSVIVPEPEPGVLGFVAKAATAIKDGIVDVADAVVRNDALSAASTDAKRVAGVAAGWLSALKRGGRAAPPGRGDSAS